MRTAVSQQQQLRWLDSIAPPPRPLSFASMHRCLPLLLRPPLPPRKGGASLPLCSARPRTTRCVAARVISRSAICGRRGMTTEKKERQRRRRHLDNHLLLLFRAPPLPLLLLLRRRHCRHVHEQVRKRESVLCSREKGFGIKVLKTRTLFFLLFLNINSQLPRRSSPSAMSPLPLPLLLHIRPTAPATSSPTSPTPRRSWDGESCTPGPGNRSESSGK